MERQTELCVSVRKQTQVRAPVPHKRATTAAEMSTEVQTIMRNRAV